jgi:predicted dehydrogenase
MRRFDPGYVRAKQKIEAGELGRIELFRALSCDTYPPSPEFLLGSGGIFLDMAMHDFDLVCEVEEVEAWVQQGKQPSPGPQDALETLRLALAATQSWGESRQVKVSEIRPSSVATDLVQSIAFFDRAKSDKDNAAKTMTTQFLGFNP